MISITIFDIYFSILLALIVNFPDLYTILKNKKSWVPVNCPPFAIGDEVHYFTEISELHKKIFKKNSNLDSLTGVMKITIVSLLINIPFYHLGYLLGDRRFSILSVKFFNSFFLFLAFVVFFQALAVISNTQISNLSIYILSLAVFALYPFYFISPSIRSSIFFNLFNDKHIFRRSSANELVRSVQMSTTAPILLMILSYTIFSFYTGLEIFDYFILLVFFLLLMFSYAPIGLGYGFIVSSFMLVEFILGRIGLQEFFFIFVVIAILSIVVMKIQFKIISKCNMTNEVFGNNHFTLKFSKRGVVETMIFVFSNIFILLALFLYFGVSWQLLAFLSILSCFALPNVFANHQAGRFWIRGFLAAHMAVLFFVLYILIDFGNIEVFILVVQVIFLSVYFYINSRYLYENYSTKAFNQSNLDKALEFSTDNRTLCINSVELTYFIHLYSERKILFQNYSVQNSGYKKNIERLIYTLKACGYSYDEIFLCFQQKRHSSELIKNRTNENFSDKNYMKKAKSNELIFMATYIPFNNKIVIDGFYDIRKEEFTESFFEYMKSKYNNLGKVDESKYEILCRKSY
jgi:hypothetical protein